MLGSLGAAAAGVLAVASSMHGAHAVSCTFATGSCTAQPCPTSTLDRWGSCILTNLTAPAMCSEDCVLLQNSDGNMPPGICALPAASVESLTTAQIAQIQACTAAPDTACVTAGLSLLDQTGCENCIADLLETETRNGVCGAVAGGAAACEAVDTPCEGEPPVGAPEAAAVPEAALGPEALGPDAALGPMDVLDTDGLADGPAPTPLPIGENRPAGQGPTVVPTVASQPNTPPAAPETAQTPSGAAALAGACAALGAAAAAVAL